MENLEPRERKVLSWAPGRGEARPCGSWLISLYCMCVCGDRCLPACSLWSGRGRWVAS